jgi:hypothetical protein
MQKIVAKTREKNSGKITEKSHSARGRSSKRKKKIKRLRGPEQTTARNAAADGSPCRIAKKDIGSPPGSDQEGAGEILFTSAQPDSVLSRK